MLYQEVSESKIKKRNSLIFHELMIVYVQQTLYQYDLKGFLKVPVCYVRCPEFPSLPASCVLDVDPEDACCQRPTCTDPKTPVVPVFKPGTSGQSSVSPPEPSELYQGTQTIPYSFTISAGSGSNTPTANPNYTPGTGIGKQSLSIICIRVCMYSKLKFIFYLDFD